MSKLKHYYLPITWMTVVILMCLLPKGHSNSYSWLKLIPHLDKYVHISMYLIMGFLFKLANFRDTEGQTQNTVIILLVCTILGLVIEILQPYVGRTCDYYDVISNSIGLVFGIIMYSVFKSNMFMFKLIRVFRL